MHVPRQVSSAGGWTPLMGASYHGHDGMVAYLLVRNRWLCAP